MALINKAVLGIKNGLVVSCQAERGEPLHGPEHMVAMAKSALAGGASGIRANGPADIRAIRAQVDLPLIGIFKRNYVGFEPVITPTLEEVQLVLAAGADIVAVDATNRIRPGNIGPQEFIKSIRAITSTPIMADISTLEEALAAAAWGVDLIATTLNGYTHYTCNKNMYAPNLELLEAIARRVSIPVIAEGRIWEPQQALLALKKGAWAVTVGGAITRPQLITRRFVDKIKRL